MTISFCLFICLLFGCSTQTRIKKDEPIEMVIILYENNQRDFLRDFILYQNKNFGTEIINEEYYIVIKNANIEILQGILLFLNLRLDIIANNIANAYTTRTNEGEPFTRKYLKISIENGVEIMRDTKTPFRYVFDPSHPDAIIGGALDGFVIIPNVDIQSEKLDLATTAGLYSSILEFTQNNSKNIIW
jgi:flagellar basal-body rod protein FlgC